MYTCSNLLLPKATILPVDFSNFQKDSHSMKQVGSGYEQLVVHTSSDLFNNHQRLPTMKTLWDEIQSVMKSKAWKSIDAVFADERMQSLFHKVLKLVIEDPISAYSVWGEGDIFRRKPKDFNVLPSPRHMLQQLANSKRVRSTRLYQFQSSLMLHQTSINTPRVWHKILRWHWQ